MEHKRTYFKVNTIIVVAILFGIFVYLKYLNPADQQQAMTGTKISPTIEIPEFALTDTDGSPFTKANLEGKWTVATLGFTQCPDICPITLGYFRDEMDKLDKNTKDNVQFVFVSVDPVNDTPAQLKTYIASFNPNIKGVTGTQQELIKFVGSFHSYFQKSGQKVNASDLTALTHSPSYFLINPKGEWQAIYSPPVPKGSLSADLNNAVKSKTIF